MFFFFSFEDQNDDYSSIMAAALADRLAEAFAEYLHREVRINLWGYSKNEELSPEDMLKVKCHAKTGIILVVVIP